MNGFVCYRCGGWPCVCADSIALIEGDNCDVLGQLPKESIDLVVTSPPYDDLRTYGGHSWDFYGVAWQLKRVLKPGGVIVWVVADATKDGSESGSSMRQALHFQSLGFNLHDTMIWESDKPPMNDNRYQACFEYMFVLSNGRPATFNCIEVPSVQRGTVQNGRYRQRDGSMEERHRVALTLERKTKTSIWYTHTGPHEGSHPAPFPEALARDHILSWSNPGDTVLDPFNGSGTTTKMAKLTGRKGIGIEVNPDYLPIAANRLRQEVLQFTD